MSDLSGAIEELPTDAAVRDIRPSESPRLPRTVTMSAWTGEEARGADGWGWVAVPLGRVVVDARRW